MFELLETKSDDDADQGSLVCKSVNHDSFIDGHHTLQIKGALIASKYAEFREKQID